MVTRDGEAHLGSLARFITILRDRAQRALPALGMLMIILVIYRRIVAGRVLAGGDLQVYFYPYWVQVVRSLQQGRVPLWNPTLFTGAPLAANSQVGLFYPPNWVLWVASIWGARGARVEIVVARSLHLSLLMHVWLAGLSCYLLGRRHRLGRWAASVAGLIYAGSGFLGVHMDHLNQLQALAWLPMLFLPRVRIRRWGSTWQLPRPLSVMAFGMVVLSGHMQMAFIAAIGILVWSALDVGVVWVRSRQGRANLRELGQIVRLGAGTFLPFVLGGLLAGVQLLPSVQLAGLSGRSVGLDWREAVSFSIPPWELHRVLLPGYLVSPLLPEGVAYLGIGGLLAAALGGAALFGPSRSRKRGRERLPWVALSGAGVLLALGAYNPLYLAAARLHVPGFVHFRAPARFLALYVLGTSLLAGMGMQDLFGWLSGIPLLRRGRMAFAGRALLSAAIGLELAVAAEALPHARATVARAYWDLRPATAHLIAGRALSEAAGRVPSRFLSMSQMLFEIGDKAEIETIYGAELSSDALWSYMVAAKQREILAPNLPMLFDVPAVDGYDGGLLPLRHFIDFSKLMIPGGTLDGRLRETLTQIPDDRWLDLLDVQYLLTDKTGDVWVDGVLYDQQFQPTLAAGERLEVGWFPEDFPANAVRVLHAGGQIQVDVELADGRRVSDVLSDGGAAWVRWVGTTPVRALSITAGEAGAHLQAVSLLDGRVGAFYPVTLSDRFWLMHSGDVKVYERLTAPSRAIVLYDCAVVDSVDAAVHAMAQPAFTPSETIVVLKEDDAADLCLPINARASGTGGASGAPASGASVVLHSAHEVVIDTTLRTSGYLLLKDAWYPGWEVSIQDQDRPTGTVHSAPLLRADLLFRAVALEAGSWRVTIRYVPRIVYLGLFISLCGLAMLIFYGLFFRREPQMAFSGASSPIGNDMVMKKRFDYN